MKFSERLPLAAMRSDDFKMQLFAFLGGDETVVRLASGQTMSRDDARELLRKLIPAKIEVRDVCRLSVAAVAAAPHVSYDNWSEYFCNRAARQLGLGRVIARNYRDLDGHRIPVSIGRHVHVNRPMESDGPGRKEYETERAQKIFTEYCSALLKAAGCDLPPIDLLVEFHSHRRTPCLEIATTGVTETLANALFEVYNKRRRESSVLPEMRIEPLHDVQLKAEGAKTRGSMQSSIALRALHIEIPREARQGEEFRWTCHSALIAVLERLIVNIRTLG